jgi:hypothetical protein
MTIPRTQRRPPRLLLPERLRSIERPFGWLPCRLLSEGWLEALSGPAKQLYMLLATAADRQGLSFYSDARIDRVLALGAGQLARARLELTETDLLAFDGHIYQLLSLPRHPPRHPPRPDCPPRPRPTPPEPCKPSSTDDAASPPDELPEDVQAILRKLLR